jgi:hypothetical protein
MAAKRTFTDAAATELTIGLIEKGVQIFLRNPRVLTPALRRVICVRQNNYMGQGTGNPRHFRMDHAFPRDRFA